MGCEYGYDRAMNLQRSFALQEEFTKRMVVGQVDQAKKDGRTASDELNVLLASLGRAQRSLQHANDITRAPIGPAMHRQTPAEKIGS